MKPNPKNIVLLAALAAASHSFAQTTWSGATDQSWTNASNWSAGVPGVNSRATINTATGNFPIISTAVDKSATAGGNDLWIGSGSGANGRLDINSGGSLNTSGTWVFVGENGGTGTLNVNSGGSITSNADIRLGRNANGTGHVVADGGSIAVSSIARDGTGISTVTVKNGGSIVTTAGNLENVTATSLTGTLTAGGSINMLNGVTSTNDGGAITATGGEMRIGNNGTHTLTQTSGSVTTNNWFVVGIGASGAGTFNMSGGTLTSASVNATAFSTIGAGGGTGTVNLSGGTYNDMNKTVLGENAGGTGNFNLSGSGVLHTKQVEVGAGAGNLTFNGGTLRARAASTDFIDSATVTTINAGGGTVDTNGFAVTIADGIAGSGDLTKIGAGALTMSGSNTYTGDTIVSAGTLFVTGALAGEVSVANGATIGGNGTVSGNLTIADGGMIDFSLGALVVNSSSTVSFGGFSLDDVIGFNKETAVNGEYTILAGSFTLDSANIANFGLANAYTRGDGKQVYFQQGSLNIVVVPETSSVLLGLAGSLLLLRRRRN